MDVERKVSAQLTELIGARSKRQAVFAVAFSGGGDSTALLSLALKWSKARPVHALIIDHALRPDSAKEAKLAQARANALGAETQILKCEWGSTIPKTGIQEKARHARYQLLGDACRELGAENLLLGHNQDDQTETVLMRQDAGSGWRGLAGIKQQVRAPIWPALQGLNVVRPMLSCGRYELRSYNKNNDLEWIDDPSNANTTFARIRARKYLTEHPIEKQNLLTISKSATEILKQEQAQLSDFIQANTKPFDWGGLTLLPEFCTGKLGQMAEALRYILPAISGDPLPPSYEKRMNLVQKLRSPDFTGATLGGVRLVPAQDSVLCVRDLGALLGRADVHAIAPLHLQPSETQIWDGRFAVSTAQCEVYVDALANWTQALDKPQKALLKSIPEPARGGLPVFIRNNQIAHIPFVDFSSSKHGFKVCSVTEKRLAAFLGDFYR